ncbi:MAG: DUF1287 domain-containing protein [Lachnospiraceae bacterium]|nr:DUF1287 domain-containing protein [Lachnospiraceae bacterium]
MKHKIQIICIIALVGILGVLYWLNIIPHFKYQDEDFGITTYKSQVDYDNDGIDDQTDILQGVKAYISTNPKYKSKYYGTGYPDDEYGVCTDVVAQGLLNAGYDLMTLVNEHVLAHGELYEIEKPDINIDFRRVRNLLVYFEDTAIRLTTDVSQIEEWQAGDIVVFEGHVGIVSSNRNRKGIPYIIHHASPQQLRYEEDILENRKDEILGHYRVS